VSQKFNYNNILVEQDCGNVKKKQHLLMLIAEALNRYLEKRIISISFE
jgi:hypothetical protein